MAASNRYCLIAGGPGTHRILGRAGDPVAGLPGVNYVRFVRPLINSDVRVAVWGVLPAVGQKTHTALCVDRGGGLEVALHSTAPAPGFAPEVTLGGFFAGPFLNRAGQILLVAGVEGPGIDPAKNKVLRLIEPDLTVRRVAWPGMPVTGDGGTSSTGVPVNTGSSGAFFRVVATY
jgi:hypothetical protein